MKITKAIIPAAGLGTRLLPLSKAIPKEMMPLLDKPALQYIIEEGTAADITSFCIIMNDDKKPYAQNYFQQPQPYSITFQPQPQPLGLGHAVLMGQEHIDQDAYFAVLLPDDIIESDQSCIKQLITCAYEYNALIIAVEKIEREQTRAYGIISPKKQLSSQVIEVAHVLEKPEPQDAPSDYGIIGRYILPYRIFDAIRAISSESKAEIQLTDAIAYLIQQGERVCAYVIEGTRYDIGSINGLFNATVAMGSKKDPYQSIFQKYV